MKTIVLKGGNIVIVILNKKTIQMIIAIILIIMIIVTGIIVYNKRKITSTVISNHEISKPIESGSNSSNYTAFACNVDWGNEVIPEILEILREKDTKITFFVTGRWVREFPDLFKNIVNEGHEIGSHGYEHLNYSKLSLEQNREQIKTAEEMIVKHGSTKPTLFAPPSGDYNQDTLVAAEELGYKTILWSIDTIDWRQGSTKDIIISRVMDKPNHNGAIILMHPMPETAKALPLIIDKLHEKNLKVGRVTDVLMD